MRNRALTIDYVDNKTKHEFHLPITVFMKPSDARQYNKLQKLLDRLVDEVRGDDKHPLAPAMQIIGDNLELYDDENCPGIGENVSHIEMVEYLMKKNNLLQKDLASIFGGQANVSKFLSGERPLTKSQITGLKKKFAISADFFI